MAKFLNVPKPVSSPELADPVRNLWRNVLIVALEDAMGKSLKNKNISLGTHLTARMAQDYFLFPNRDFKMVCTLAGFDHEYVRMRAKKTFKEKEKINDTVR